MSITWNGVSSDTIGVIVERIPNRYVPTRRFSPQQVAGRNGNILLVDKSFPNVEQEYEVYLSAEAQGLPSVARACAEWLMGPDGYCRLQDSYDTTVYREAFLMGGYDLENILNKFGRCTITFSCKPQKYLLAGDTPISIPAGSTSTYTGSSVQFDGITGASITSLSTTIAPTQDLHGYANPWPGGGGKNILPLTEWFQAGYTSTSNGVTVTVNADGSITLSGTASAQADFYFSRTTGGVTQNPLYVSAGTYTISMTGTQTISGVKLVMSGSGQNGYPYSEASSNGTAKTGAVTDATQPFNYFLLRITSGTVSDGTYYIQFESGSTATSWTPYENICPISGLTGLLVYRTGKNKVDISTAKITHQTTIYSVELSAGQYTLSAYCTNNTSISGYLSIRLSGVAKGTVTIASGDTNTRKNTSFTLTESGTYDIVGSGASSGYDFIVSNVQLESGSTATTYEPYNGNTYSVDWSAQAGTVYGGTLDVVTGVLTVNRYTKSFTGTESYTNYTSVIQCNETLLVGLSVAGSDILCSHSTNQYVHFSNSSKNKVQFDKATFSVTSADELKSKLATWNTDGEPLQYSYELATPLTYQLTPQVIGVLTGTNYVWLSDGDVSLTVTTPLGGIVTNPTPFEARPLLEVSGVGEITINGKSIQILESVSDFQIDCESMEAEDNSKIYCMDFPELSGGENEIVGDGSITALTVTPRWWTL